MPSLTKGTGLCVISTCVLILTNACSTPSSNNILPDSGPTTEAIYQAHLSGEVAPNIAADKLEDDGQPSQKAPVRQTQQVVGVPILPYVVAESEKTSTALESLKRDFQIVPNPDVLGYVYPHLRGDLPVPGYFTAYPLYEKTHYALPGEGTWDAWSHP